MDYKLKSSLANLARPSVNFLKKRAGDVVSTKAPGSIPVWGGEGKTAKKKSVSLVSK